jgi:preprotein translocase SecE subunit
MNAIATYFREAVQELELVRWPTRQQAVRLSTVVLGFTVVSALIFGLVDLGLQSAVIFILSHTL